MTVGEPASIGTLLELGNCALDTLRFVVNQKPAIGPNVKTSPATFSVQDAKIDARITRQVLETALLYATTQLVMPENLKELAMYSLGLIKSRALKGGREPTDRRSHELRLLKGMGPAALSLYLYPRIIALHTLDHRGERVDVDQQLRG